MEFLDKVLLENARYKTLLSDVKKGCLPVCCTGLSQIHKSVAVSALCSHSEEKILVITPDEASMSEMFSDLCAMGKRVFTFPIRDFCFREIMSRSAEYEHIRINTLSRILDGDFDIIISSAAAASQYTMPPDILKENTITLSLGDEIPPERLAQRLISAGYSRQMQVEGKGQFSVRGGILDVFAPNCENPFRIEFFGDEIDSVSEFDLSTQRRTQGVQKITVTPAKEIVFESEKLSSALGAYAAKAKLNENARRQIEKDIDMICAGADIATDRYLNAVYAPATLFDYMQEALITVSDFSAVMQNLKGYIGRTNEDIKLLLEDGFLTKKFAEFSLTVSRFSGKTEKAVFMENFAAPKYDFALKDLINFNFKRISAWHGDINVLLSDIGFMLDSGGRAVVLAGEEKAAQVLCEDIRSRGISADFKPHLTGGAARGLTVTTGGLSSGMEFPDEKFLLITHNCIFGSKKHSRVKKSENSFSSLEELHMGDYVVHASHGIGIFAGIHKITSAGITKDYIKINYAKSDVLYVPVTQLDLISKYIGASENGTVKINKLGSGEWQKTKSRVKKAVRDMAKELTQLYAKRMSVKGYAFEADTQLQKDFEARFPYVETEDQLNCIKEIKSDMERDVPMDRLLCGDVGFGKTEVALRAAFKCISEGKQCALLVPTTILAWQHYNTALSRFGDMPVNIRLLSRFASPAQQAETVRDLLLGKVDMVVGTHRLISNDVKFKNLGLVIIDEEQRFGVAQKEKLKKEYPAVDVLTLSATPIPRTLNMAMSGLRDMSSIEEPPGDRLPVQSYVLEYDEGIIYDAIRRELRRSGQVYYLHNRVESIVQCAAKIKSKMPDARVEVAHGRMSEQELSAVWKRLIEHEIDILVCTTIIETGVDVPNANTLIIEDADRMGLSQLHQLRGRVGRSPRRAYAYFCFKRDKQMSDIAEKRLDAIREYTEFGAGFKIAMRDLEIRGAGNILGGEQHGNMECVGYDMYIKLLNDAINEEKGIKKISDAECTVDLSISAHIPERYIQSLPARLGIYKRIAQVKNDEEKSDIIDELIDRFGDPPKTVLGLIDIALLRNKAARLGIYEITELKNGVKLSVNQMNEEQISVLTVGFGKRFCISADDVPYYTVKYKSGQTKADLIAEIAGVL